MHFAAWALGPEAGSNASGTFRYPNPTTVVCILILDTLNAIGNLKHLTWGSGHDDEYACKEPSAMTMTISTILIPPKHPVLEHARQRCISTRAGSYRFAKIRHPRGQRRDTVRAAKNFYRLETGVPGT